MHRLIFSFIFAFSLNLCAFAQVDTYPNKPIRLVVPFPPGGTIEAMSRVIGEEMTKNWGQPILVDPKPGASGNIGVQLVANSPPDGYTLIFGTQGTHGTNSILFKYDNSPTKSLYSFLNIRICKRFGDSTHIYFCFSFIN